MEQFNLEKYLRLKEEGREPKVVTGDGLPVRIICTDRKHQFNKSIVALVESFDCESTYCYPENGRIDSRPDRHDLFFAPVKREGWINIYHGFYAKVCSPIFESKQEAIKKRDANCIATVKIEWTE